MEDEAIKDYLFLPLLVVGITFGFLITAKILDMTLYKRFRKIKE